MNLNDKNAARVQRRFGIKPVTKEYINSFRGIFKRKPGEKSMVQELIEERRAEKEKEDRESVG